MACAEMTAPSPRMVERGAMPVACLEQDPDENDCCIHENDADRRNSHRSAGLYRGAFDLESAPRAFGCGEADHGCNPRFRGIRGDPGDPGACRDLFYRRVDRPHQGGSTGEE